MAGMDARAQERLEEWRAAVRRSGTVSAEDAEELESHLVEQVEELRGSGLDDDEAFLIAVRRLGATSAITAEYAREHGERLWKQLVLEPDGGDDRRGAVAPMIGFAVAAAIAVHLLRFTGEFPDNPRVLLNLGLVVLPVLAAYLAWRQRMPWRRVAGLGAGVAVLAAVVNLYPFDPGGATETLAAIHLPFVLWFAVVIAYLGGDVRSRTRWMDAVRFSGEWLVYYTLFALGGGVLVSLLVAILEPLSPDWVVPVVDWVLPAGAAGATVVAAWLVEAKRGVIENIAPVLTAVFTPLFGALVVLGSVGYVAGAVTRVLGSGPWRLGGFEVFGREFDRDLLIVFDLLLIVVVALLLYGLSARDRMAPRGAMDVIRFVTVVAAIVLDLVVLGTMVARIGEFGFTPNRLVVFGLNLLLVVTLAGAAWHSARFLAGRAPVARLEGWQVGVLPAYGAWALAVAVLVPVLYRFE